MGAGTDPRAVTVDGPGHERLATPHSGATAGAGAGAAEEEEEVMD